MKDETKQEIKAVLMLLKNTLVRNGVSIALTGSDYPADRRVLYKHSL